MRSHPGTAEGLQVGRGSQKKRDIDHIFDRYAEIVVEESGQNGGPESN